MIKEDIVIEEDRKKINLADINQALLDTFKIKRKIKQLNTLYSEKLNDLNDISKDIKAETVNVKIIFD